jgi:hypothetical protein
MISPSPANDPDMPSDRGWIAHLMLATEEDDELRYVGAPSGRAGPKLRPSR